MVAETLFARLNLRGSPGGVILEITKLTKSFRRKLKMKALLIKVFFDTGELIKGQIQTLNFEADCYRYLGRLNRAWQAEMADKCFEDIVFASGKQDLR